MVNVDGDSLQMKMEDILICDPISRRGKYALKRLISCDKSVNMTIDDFYTQIYTEPIFCHGAEHETEDKDEADDFAFTTEGIEFRDYQRVKDDFEGRFLTDVTNKFLLIRGASGSGKSIYMNYLIWKRSKLPNLGRTFAIDLEYSEIDKIHGNVKFPPAAVRLPSTNGTIPSPPWLFLIILIDEAYKCIYKIIDKNDKAVSDRIKTNLKRIYNLDFCDEEGKIFDLLRHRPKYDGSLSDFLSEDKLRILQGEIFQSLLNLCIEDYDDAVSSIRNTLRIMTRILLCDSDLDNPKQILFTFDSIEHYIDVGKRIYDDDIRLIADSVFTFTQNEENYYQNRGFEFAKYFKFVMAVRDTTDKMLSSNVHIYFSQLSSNSINTTNWFLAEDCYEKKLKYFTQKLPNDNPAVRFFQLVISDPHLSKGASILKMLSSMYNHNKRRITRVLAKTADIFCDLSLNPEKNTKIIPLSNFEDYWNSEDKDVYKYLLRRVILRLIWNIISSTGFFRSIYDHLDKNIYDDMSTYARRILIWLSSNTDFHKDEYVSFSKLVECVLHSPDLPSSSSVGEESIKKLAKILLMLDEFRFEDSPYNKQMSLPSASQPNRWCQLIVLKFNDKKLRDELDDTKLAEKILSEYGKRRQDSKDFGLKITEAGCFFTYMQCDFEYFACRYDTNNQVPLPLMMDPDKIINTIKNVFESAIKCIDRVLLHELSFFNKNYRASYGKGYHYINETGIGGRGTEVPFPLRVIRNHRNYLLHYKRYIEKISADKDSYINKAADNKVLQTINDYIFKYEEIFSKLKRSNYEVKGKVIENYFDSNVKL